MCIHFMLRRILSVLANDIAFLYARGTNVVIQMGLVLDFARCHYVRRAAACELRLSTVRSLSPKRYNWTTSATRMRVYTSYNVSRHRIL